LAVTVGSSMQAMILTAPPQRSQTVTAGGVGIRCGSRFMKRLLKETKIKERFTEHDLRAKCASDAETLARAQQLFGHADSKITERVYRRKPKGVRPLR
jgi:integrase